jgi:hypothetical protein
MENLKWVYQSDDNEYVAEANGALLIVSPSAFDSRWNWTLSNGLKTNASFYAYATLEDAKTAVIAAAKRGL